MVHREYIPIASRMQGDVFVVADIPKARVVSKGRIENGSYVVTRHPSVQTEHHKYTSKDKNVILTAKGHFKPLTAPWLTYAASLVKPMNPIVTHIIVEYEALEADTWVKSGITYVIPDSVFPGPSSRFSSEKARLYRRYRHGVPGDVSEHDMAVQVSDYLSGQYRTQGLSPAKALSASRKELQNLLGFKDARSLRNILQPGGRRNLSPEKHTILQNLYTKFNLKPTGQTLSAQGFYDFSGAESYFRRHFKKMRERYQVKNLRIVSLTFLGIKYTTSVGDWRVEDII